MREEMGAVVGQAWASHALNLLDGTGVTHYSCSCNCSCSYRYLDEG